MSGVVPRIKGLRLRQLCLSVPGIDVSGKAILDYGGNRGNLLADISNRKLELSSYINMDVDKESLDYFRNMFPDAKAVHYNRFNPVYNTTGEKFIPFPLKDDSVNIVFSHSVNTHSSFEDYLFDLKEMSRVVKPGGVVCTSLITEDFLRLIHRKRAADYGSTVDFSVLQNPRDVLYFVDNDTVVYNSSDIPQDSDFLIAYYNIEWLKQRLLQDNISARYAAPLQPSLQGMLIIEQ